jgi:NADH-quinone oxidoreductase subunit M
MSMVSNDAPLLLVLGLLPVAGAVVVGLAGVLRWGDELAKKIALGTSLATLVVAIVMCVQFKARGAAFQFSTDVGWIDQFGVRFSLGADGIALVLIALTALLVPVVLLSSWHEAEQSRRSAPTFFALVLVLEALLVGVFSATDVFLFYVFFEAMLIPMYFLIGSFGGPQRQYAAVKFLLYSLAGGLLMLAALIALYVESKHQLGTGTFDFATLTTLRIPETEQRWLFLGFFIAFAVKAPLVPFHTWLPDAGAEGPTGASVLLVGVMDKVGTFGFLRYCLPLFPQASRTFGPWILGLAIAGILYGAIVAIGQRDVKRLVSYTSVAHFGFIAMGVFAFTSQGASGAVLYMVNHGLSTGLLFLVVGFLVNRVGSRDLAAFGGVGKVAPVLGGVFLLAGLSSLALPGTNAFVSEFLTLVGTFTNYPAAAILATLGIVLAAIYVLWVYQRAVQGPLKAGLENLQDLSLREIVAVAPVVVLIVIMGFYPKPVLDVINPSVDRTLQSVGVKDPAPKVAGYSPQVHSYTALGSTGTRRLGSRTSPFLAETGATK